MALRDEIEAIRDRTLSMLNDAHDYYTYTKGAWHVLQHAIRRDEVKFSIGNPATKSRIVDKELIPLAERYVAQELAFATLQQFVSIFEGFVFDVLRQWLLAFPKSLSERELKGKEIFDLADKAAIIDALVAKEVNDVLYRRPTEWFRCLKDLASIRTPSDADGQRFAEIKATRDVLIHGQGIANRYYMDKAGKSARVQLGQPLEVPEPYHKDSWELICKLVREIGSEMAAKAS